MISFSIVLLAFASLAAAATIPECFPSCEKDNGPLYLRRKSRDVSGFYEHDPSGRYSKDSSGKYIHDDVPYRQDKYPNILGRYRKDDSGRYIHVPNPYIHVHNPYEHIVGPMGGFGPNVPDYELVGPDGPDGPDGSNYGPDGPDGPDGFNYGPNGPGGPNGSGEPGEPNGLDVEEPFQPDLIPRPNTINLAYLPARKD